MSADNTYPALPQPALRNQEQVMAKINLPILPFPENINRQRFGDYVSGLTDGEGCFYLGLCSSGKSPGKIPQVSFAIRLRSDDTPVLRLIQSFFGCGCLRLEKARKKDRYKCHESINFVVNSIPDLVQIIIPHFLAHPLYAKKSRDFQLWQECVLLIHQIQQLPVRRMKRKRPGAGVRWTEVQLSRIRPFIDAIRTTREFNAVSLPSVVLPKDPTLFDGLDSE